MQCNVQSLWAYWQNDEEKFKRKGKQPSSNLTATYLDHFLICSRYEGAREKKA